MTDRVRGQYDVAAARARLEREVRVGRVIGRRYLLELHVILYGEAACPLSQSTVGACFACSRVPDVVSALGEPARPPTAPPVTV